MLIGISSRDVSNPKEHPRLLYEELNESAIADIRRRIALGVKQVVIEALDQPRYDYQWPE